MPTNAAPASSVPASLTDSVDQAERPLGGTRENWFLLTLLVSINILHTVDRQIISALLEPLRRAFQLSDSQLGFLSGIAYAGAAVLAAVPAGVLADRFSRKKVLITAFALWSGFTAMCGAATGQLTLFLARIGVGAAGAAGPPCCLSMIADSIAERRRGGALGVFYGSSALGGLLAYSAGAWIAAHYGWSAAFLAAGAPALALVPLMMWFLREPARRVTRPQPKNAPVREAVAAITQNRQLTLLIVAATIASLPGGGLYVWVTSLLIRNHGMELAKAGSVVAIVAGLIVPLGMFSGGRLSDKFLVKSPGAPMFLASVTCLGAAILGVIVAFSPVTNVTIAALCLHGLLVVIYVPPSTAMVMKLSPAGPRTTILATVTALQILAAGVGPILTGFTSDLFGGAHSLSSAIAVVSVLSLIPGILYAVLGQRVVVEAHRDKR
jgi:predicted MFS family arabinose efflux permease